MEKEIVMQNTHGSMTSDATVTTLYVFRANTTVLARRCMALVSAMMEYVMGPKVKLYTSCQTRQSAACTQSPAVLFVTTEMTPIKHSKAVVPAIPDRYMIRRP